MEKALSEAGVKKEDLSGLRMAGEDLCALSREDFLLLAPTTRVGLVLFNRLQHLKGQAAHAVHGSYMFSYALCTHARMLFEEAELPPSANEVEHEHASDLRTTFAELRSRVQYVDGRHMDPASIMRYMREGADVLAALPQKHPLALKEGRYVWTPQREAAVRRLMKSIVARCQGHHGVGGMCAAIADIPGSGKTTTMRLVATLSSFLMDRVVPFYHDYRDGVVLPSDLFRTAFVHRTGRTLGTSATVCSHAEHPGLSSWQQLRADAEPGVTPFELTSTMVPVGFLDEAHLMWEPHAPPTATAVHAVREVYQVGAKACSGLIFLAGGSKRLVPRIVDDTSEEYTSYPAGLGGVDHFAVLRLGVAETMRELREIVDVAGTPGCAEKMDAERLCTMQYHTGGVFRQVVNYLLDEGLPDPPTVVQLPGADSLEMAILEALHHKYVGVDRVQGVFERPSLSEAEAMRVNLAYHEGRGGGGEGPSTIVPVLERLADRYVLRRVPDDDESRWRLAFPKFVERLDVAPLTPLAEAAPALFLDPYWRQGPEARLAEAAQRRNVVFVVGAGVTMASCPSAPSWYELITRGVHLIPSEEARVDAMRVLASENDPVRAASLVHSLVPKEEFAQFLEEQFAELKAKDERLVRAIGDYEVPVLTCNYDALFDSVQGRRSYVWTDEQWPVEAVLRGEPVTVHVHGRYDVPESVVFGEASYQRVLRDDRLQDCLRALHLSDRTLVYVGFGAGLGDPNLGSLLKWSDQKLRDADYRQYVLMREQEARTWAEGKMGVVQKTHTIPVVYGEEFGDLPGFVEKMGADKNQA